MKRIIVFLLVIQASLIFGAQFEILSEIKEEQMHMGLVLLEDDFKLDNRGELGALVIINCGLKDVLIQNKAMKIYQVDKKGAIWVVMKQRCKNFTISKENFPNYRYDFPFSLQSGSVYSMTIGEKQATLKNETDNLKTVTFEFNTDAVMISYDNKAPLKSSSNLLEYTLPEGIFNFKFTKSGYETIHQIINTYQNNQKVAIELKAGSNNEKVLASGALVIHSEPEGARVILNGQEVGITPYQGDHYIGNYSVLIQKELFNSQASSFDLNGDGIMQLPLYNLIPKYGIINISSNPAGATAKLDGKVIGKTPLNDVRIESGPHTLILELATYETATKEFSLKDGNQLTFNEKLIPKFSDVTINCPSTDGVSLTLNGKVMGKLPYHNSQLLAGTYQLKISKELWLSTTEELIIPANETISRDFVLIPNFSDVTINCPSTDGVSLTLNGKVMGKLPYHNSQLLAGTYQLKISKELWLTTTEELIIPAKETISRDFVLSPNYGTIKVTAKDADIYLNEEKVGKNYLEIDKRPGIYQITAKIYKYEDATVDIHLLVGQEESISLEPRPRAASISILTVDKYSSNRAVSNANIYLDNRLIEDKTPALISLLYGDYDLKITHNKFLDYQEKLKVRENENREITIPLETYSGTRRYHHDNLKNRAWLASGLTTLLYAGAVICNITSNAYYEEYQNTKNPVEALDYKDKTQQWEDIRDYTYYAASGVAIYSLYSWIKTAIYKD